MKLTLLILLLMTVIFEAVNAGSMPGDGFRTCKAWDTFCKSPPQIVATKCRLGVPVKHEQCESLGLRKAWYMTHSSNVEGLPVTALNRRTDTGVILAPYLVGID